MEQYKTEFLFNCMILNDLIVRIEMHRYVGKLMNFVFVMRGS